MDYRDRYKMKQTIIIGAGLAGLSAANRLLDNNIKPIIIDSDIIGKPKVCGEFFSPECHEYLKSWGVKMNLVHNIHFITNNSKMDFKIPEPAASLNRSKVELKLYERALGLGATFYFNTKVEKIVPPKNKKGLYLISLSNGKSLEANYLIVAAGRLNFLNQTKQNIKPKYIGIKSHYKNVDIDNDLYMYLDNGLYMGVSKIDENLVNVCCLVKREEFEKYKTPDDFMQHLINKSDVLKKQFKNGTNIYDDWLTVPVFNFGKKIIQKWPNSYFIGDAAASIYPASGNGLAIGISSGVMAADHIANSSKEDFHKLWQKRYSRRFFYASILHKIFMSPRLYNFGTKLIKIFPGLSNFFYKFTRG